jgi:hypothetical protein
VNRLIFHGTGNQGKSEARTYSQGQCYDSNFRRILPNLALKFLKTNVVNNFCQK